MADASLLGTVERYYTGKFEQHGARAEGVDWNSTESQELRFEQLLQVVDDADADFSLVDYGCGYGALARYLDASGRTYAYSGLDLSETMLEHARAEFGDSGRRRFFHPGAAVEPADYAVASGIFNVRFSIDEASWRDYVLETVGRLNELGRRGFAFNMLTSYSDADRMRADLFYGDPCFFFDRCKREYSRDVALLHDYGLYEFTILVRK